MILETANASEILNAALDLPSLAEINAVADHVLQQLYDGRLIDSVLVSAAEVAGGVATWEPGEIVDEIIAKTTVFEEGEGNQVELVMESSEDTDEEFTDEVAVDGSGMGSATSIVGGTTLVKNCNTYTHSSKNKLTGCVQKVKPKNDGSTTRDYYVYNRWGTAEGAVINYQPDYKTDYFYIGTRPRDGYESLTKGMSDYFPHDSTTLCNEGASVTVGVGGLSMNIPLGSCSHRYPSVDADVKRMALINDPALGDASRVAGADYTHEVYTNQGATSPNLGYRQYGNFCHGYGVYKCTNFTGLNGW